MALTVFGGLSVREPDHWTTSSRVSDAGEPVTDSGVLGLSAVWGCVNLVAGTIATLPLVVYRSDGVSKTVARDHPLYRLLHDSPNYDQTSVDFVEFVAASLELWGNAYIRVNRSEGARGSRVTSLEPVAPNLVVTRRLPNGSIEYAWTSDGVTHRETDAGMAHVRGFGGNPLGGMSTLHFGRNVFGLARAVDRAAGTTFRNGMRASGVLTFKDWLSPENRVITQTKLADHTMGAVNAGRPLILEGGTTWQSLSMNPDDAQMLESRRFSVEEVCRMFGVPPHMVGHTENSTSWGTGLAEQTLAFQKFTLRRRLKRIEQAFEKQLLTPAERAGGLSIEFNLEGLLRGDSEARADFYEKMLGMGVMTINEARALENLPPVSGGEVPRIQMQNVPITGGPNDLPE